MDFEDVKRLYDKKREQYGLNAWRYVSELFAETKQQFVNDYRTSLRATQKLAKGQLIDAEQAWRNFKGRAFEHLILYMVSKEVQALGLKCILGEALTGSKLSRELSQIRRGIVVHYGKYDIVPDVDLIVYDPNSLKIIGVISCKTTLRERIAQTAYWKLKLIADPVTEHIQVYFITPDEDGDLIHALDSVASSRGFKNRILVEHELDGTYTLRDVEESEKVKTFDKFIADLKLLLTEGR